MSAADAANAAAAAFPWRATPRPHKLVVVEFVAAGARVALMLRHWIRNWKIVSGSWK